MTFSMRRLGLLRIAIAPIALSLCVVPACGGDADSGSKAATGGSSSSGGSGSGAPPHLDTGLDGDKPLGSLTPDEQQQLCDKTEELVDEVLPEEKLCHLLGVLAGASGFGDLFGGGGASGFAGAPSIDVDPATACEDAKAACLAAPEETTTECAVPSNCDATVAEYEACLNDMSGLFAGATKTLPACDAITPLALLGFGALANPTPSCDLVNEKCPGVLDTVNPIPPDTDESPSP